MQAWIDVHAHINMLEISKEEERELSLEAGVERVITIGTCPEDNPLVLSIAKNDYPRIHCTLGIHPHDAKLYDDEAEKFIRENASSKYVVAIGEMGLDYYYENSDRETQKRVFRRQVEMAIELDMPIEVHTRDAEEDTMSILGDYKGKVKGLIHCFTGTQELADFAIDIGFNVSISGVVTFKKADELRAIVKSLPLDRIHVETDSPFLAPMPLRGKTNIPSYVVHTAKVVAELKGVTEEELAEQTKLNAKKLFKKLNWD